MIESGMASFVVSSADTDPDTITHLLKLEPTAVLASGTVLRSGRVTDHHTWSIDVDSLDNTESDQTGTRSLAELLSRIHSASDRIPHLPTDCECRIVWHGSSDSTQGGFVLPIELTKKIAALGVDLHATIYLEESMLTDE